MHLAGAELSQLIDDRYANLCIDLLHSSTTISQRARTLCAQADEAAAHLQQQMLARANKSQVSSF